MSHAKVFAMQDRAASQAATQTNLTGEAYLGGLTDFVVSYSYPWTKKSSLVSSFQPVTKITWDQLWKNLRLNFISLLFYLF